MKLEVKVPVLSESVAEATIAKWHVAEGDTVSRDQNLADIETDKVVLELPAVGDGVIATLHRQEGDTVLAGEVVAIIESGQAAAAKTASAESSVDTKAASSAADSGKAASAQAAAVMPAARAILDEKGIDPASVTGSGKGGRITREDAIKASAVSA